MALVYQLKALIQTIWTSLSCGCKKIYELNEKNGKIILEHIQ